MKQMQCKHDIHTLMESQIGIGEGNKNTTFNNVTNSLLAFILVNYRPAFGCSGELKNHHHYYKRTCSF